MTNSVRTILTVVAAVIVLKLLTGGKADKDADIPSLAEDGAIIIDTRTAGEYAGGHIDGALNIPYDVIGRAIQEHVPDPSACIIVYCQSGARSSAAKKSLQNAGYSCVVNGGSYRRMRQLLNK